MEPFCARPLAAIRPVARQIFLLNSAHDARAFGIGRNANIAGARLTNVTIVVGCTRPADALIDVAGRRIRVASLARMTVPVIRVPSSVVRNFLISIARSRRHCRYVGVNRKEVLIQHVAEPWPRHRPSQWSRRVLVRMRPRANDFAEPFEGRTPDAVFDGAAQPQQSAPRAPNTTARFLRPSPGVRNPIAFNRCAEFRLLLPPAFGPRGRPSPPRKHRHRVSPLRARRAEMPPGIQCDPNRTRPPRRFLELPTGEQSIAKTKAQKAEITPSFAHAAHRRFAVRTRPI